MVPLAQWLSAECARKYVKANAPSALEYSLSLCVATYLLSLLVQERKESKHFITLILIRKIFSLLRVMIGLREKGLRTRLHIDIFLPKEHVLFAWTTVELNLLPGVHCSHYNKLTPNYRWTELMKPRVWARSSFDHRASLSTGQLLEWVKKNVKWASSWKPKKFNETSSTSTVCAEELLERPQGEAGRSAQSNVGLGYPLLSLLGKADQVGCPQHSTVDRIGTVRSTIRHSKMKGKKKGIWPNLTSFIFLIFFTGLPFSHP